MRTKQNTNARILLMGCGGIGGVIGGSLIRAGLDVTVITRNEEITNAIQTHGINIQKPDGMEQVKTSVSTSIRDTQGVFDVILLAMKATEVLDAAKDAKRLLSPEGLAVTLQNGVVVDGVAAVVGKSNLVGGLVGWGSTMTAPGFYKMTSKGEIVIGELNGQETERVRALKTILEYATPVTIAANIYGVLWSKLAINCTITALGAVTGQSLGEMLKQRKIRRLALAITSEVVDVSEAQGINLEPVGGTLDIKRLYLPPHRRRTGFLPDLWIKHLIMRVVGLKFKDLKSSMLQSLERGRPTEVPFLNGYVEKCGRIAGVDTPVNSALTMMIREIESGKRKISPTNLSEII